MKLEDAIQQRTFRNEHIKAIVNILYSHGWLEERIKLFLKQQNLTMAQYNILRILRGSENPLSTMQIRERMLDRMSDTSRIIDRMIVKNLVQKKLNSSDKRLVDITPTEKGLALLDALDSKIEELDSILYSLTESEAKMLNDLLDKMRGN